MYGETLLEDGVRPQDDRDRQQMLQAKVRQLITKKQQLTTHTRPAARPGSGGREAPGFASSAAAAAMPSRIIAR